MSSDSQPSIAEWKHVADSVAPYLFRGDEFLLGETDRIALHNSFEEFVKSNDFGVPGSTKLHLNIIPEPFLGDIENAKVYVLMANPGFGPEDYFAGEANQYFRERLKENLRGKARNHPFPFLYLDPQLSWRGGFTWWERKFRSILDAVRKKQGCGYADALQVLAKCVAALELVPYHSANFDTNLHGRLASSHAAISFLHDTVVPRAKASDAIIIVTRKVAQWALPSHKNIIPYSSGEARAASISTKTIGGKAILKFLGLE